MSFIEFPIFTGVAGELRPWISELEEFFVRKKFTAMEKMNLAQSLLEGEAESWFYRIQKTLIFYSWQELKDKLLLRFGDVADSDRIRLIAEQDRFLQEIRAEARIRRLKTTSIPEKDSIWETETAALVPTDTIPVTNWIEPRDSILATKSIQEVNSDPVMVAGASFEKDISCQAIAKIQDIESSSAKASLEKDESLEAPSVKVEGNTTMFQILDSWEEELITQNQVHVSKLEYSLQIHNESPNVCENSQAVVGCEENMFSGLSQTSQVWEPGGVLELKEPVGLVNQKKSRCLKASMFNFKRKKKGIKRRHTQLKYNYASVREDWFNTLSRREGWRKHKHENLQIISGLLGFNVGYFRCHKEYGLARMGNWSQVRVEYSLMQGKLFCKNTLPRKPATSSSMLPLYVYQMGVSDIQDNDKEMVADPVSLQLILDDLKSHMRHKWKSKHLQAVVGLQNNLSYALDVVTQPVTECKTTAAIFQLVLEQSVSHDCFLGSLWEKKNVSWLGIVCGLAECMMLKATVISAKLPETIRGREWVTDSGWLQTVLEQIIHGDDEAYTKSIALHFDLGENVHILLAAELNELQFISNAEQMFHRLFLRQHKSSSIWHRWRRKGELKEEQKNV